MIQLCDPQLKEDRHSDTEAADPRPDGQASGQASGTFAVVRRISSLSRSPEHQSRVETL